MNIHVSKAEESENRTAFHMSIIYYQEGSNENLNKIPRCYISMDTNLICGVGVRSSQVCRSIRWNPNMKRKWENESFLRLLSQLECDRTPRQGFPLYLLWSKFFTINLNHNYPRFVRLQSLRAASWGIPLKSYYFILFL